MRKGEGKEDKAGWMNGERGREGGTGVREREC
jgi:hypothetical protein